MTTAEGVGKVVSLTHQPPLPPRKYSWYSFLLVAESIPRPYKRCIRVTLICRCNQDRIQQFVCSSQSFTSLSLFLSLSLSVHVFILFFIIKSEVQRWNINKLFEYYKLALRCGGFTDYTVNPVTSLQHGVEILNNAKTLTPSFCLW